MGDQQYLVLDSPIPVDALQLGSLIKDYRHPTRGFFFEDHLKGKQKSWIRTDTNVKELMTVGSSQTEQSLLRRMLSPADHLSEIYELQSLECRVYELRQASEWFEELLSLPTARSWVQVNLHGRREVHMLTGFRTFRDGILRKRRNVKKTSASINIGVPASVALPGIKGMSLGWSRSESEGSQSQYQAHEEVIFAVSYRKIKSNLFGKNRKPSLEHGRNWLRPWTRQGAESRYRGRAFFKVFTSMTERSLPNEPGGSVESGISDYPDLLSSANGKEYSAENIASQHLASPTPPTTSPRTRSPSPLHTQMNVSAREDELRNRGSTLNGNSGTENIQVPSTDMKKAIHELVIEADGSEEVVQLEDDGVSFDSDDHSEILVEDGDWPEAQDDSSALADKTTDGVGDLSDLLTGDTQVRTLFTRAIQVLTKKSFWVALALTSTLGTTLSVSLLPLYARALQVLTKESSWIALALTFTLVTALFVLLLPLYARAIQVLTKVSLWFMLAITFALGNTPVFLVLLRRFPISSVCILAAAAVWIAYLELTARTRSGRIQLYSPETSSSNSWQSIFSAVRKDPQTYLRIPAPFFITSFMSQLRVVSRPILRPGYRRVEWTCECGERLYGDFENSVPGLVDVLEERLHFSRPHPDASNVASSESTISAPPQAHVNPPGAPPRDSRFRYTASTVDTPARVATSGQSRSLRRQTRKKYFELCINHGKWERRLGEIDISAISTDGELFREIRSKYQAVRGFRTRKLYLLEPVDIHFVQFSLEERHRLNIHEEPDSWPSPEELKRKTWEYCHPPKIPAGTFLHHLNSKKPHASAIWLPTMPKKLGRKMEEEESQLPVGWGIHVIEGLNKSLVSWLFWIATTAVFVAGIIWSIWKQNGVAVAPLAMGVLGFFVSFLTSEFYKQLET